MSRYQQANQYSDAGGSYGNDNGYNGGYTDNPDGNGGYGDGGYGKYGGNGANEYPMSSSNPYASAASPGGYTPKKKRSKWLTIGLPIILLIIIGAVLGGVLGTQLNKNKDGNSSNSGSSGAQQGVSEGGVVVPSGVSNINTAQATNTAANRYLAVQTDTYMLPVYATPTATAGYAAPSSGGSGNSWPSDPDSPSSSSPRSHPRLIAPQYKWDALKANLVSENPYFTFWNDTIMSNAEANYSLPLTPRVIDGGSGMLDVSRQIKEKVKNWSYAWKMTGDTKWADRVYRELNYAAGNDPDNAFGPANNTRWYPDHFLDVAEMASAFAIGYDWVYDHWTDDQRSMLRTAMIENALELGQQALQGQGSNNWWANTNNGAPVAGNWNCVINAGLTMAALAIQGDDTSGIADSVIGLTVPNAQANCFLGPSSDGSWNEGPNYWYFGTTGMGEMCSALTSAHGSDSGLATSQGGIALTSLYHMYVQGMTSLFNYGDHGPNKFSSTANSLLYWSTVFNEPRYALYQRDRYDAHEPFAMFWYDPAVSGTWWDDLPLDRHFNSTTDEWATGRSSWTDNDGTYWAMKGGRIPDHQNHLDMDLGDFVVDAMGQRWFGELGSGQYLALDYFTGDNQQEGGRWAYYRKRTEGQNTIQINEGNQLISATPEATFQSTGTSQGASPSFNVSETDSAFFTLDLSSAYGNGASVHRGIRFLNGRKQFLIQDDFDGVASGSTIEWRAHTNATVETNGATATLVLDSATMIAEILNAPSGVSFSTALPTRQAGGPPPVPQGQGDNIDLPNPNITVLVIQREADGQPWSNQVLLSPQWSGMAAEAYQTPSATAVTSWSL